MQEDPSLVMQRPHVRDLLSILGDLEIAAIPIGYGNTPVDGAEELFSQYQLLRQRVYVQETGIIDLTDERGEWDDDDDRSIHLAAVERQGQALSVVGTIRLIIKSERLPHQLRAAGLSASSSLLPCEREFADFRIVHLSNGRPLPACEVSRYIVEHPTKSRKLKIGRALHDLVGVLVLENDIPMTVAVVEDWLRRILLLSGVPVSKVSKSLFLERYGSENFVVSIDIDRMTEMSGRTQPMPIVPARRSRAQGSGLVPKVK